MNFNELKQLIKEIKATITCRECKGPFKDKDIRVIGTVFNEGFLHARCPECKHDMIINVVFAQIQRKHRNVKSPQPMKIVTKNDILDMRNFLKQFDGDFISLFNSK